MAVAGDVKTSYSCFSPSFRNQRGATGSRCTRRPVLFDVPQPDREGGRTGARRPFDGRAGGAAGDLGKVIRRLKAGEMPPLGAPVPEKESLQAFTATLTGELDASA